MLVICLFEASELCVAWFVIGHEGYAEEEDRLASKLPWPFRLEVVAKDEVMIVLTDLHVYLDCQS